MNPAGAAPARHFPGRLMYGIVYMLQAMAEMDSYVPNNPHFGYETAPWQPLTPPPPPPPPPVRYGYTASPEPGPLPGTLAPDPPLQTCHTPDPMLNGLSFNALDLEPLPHVYTISSHRWVTSYTPSAVTGG